MNINAFFAVIACFGTMSNQEIFSRVFTVSCTFTCIYFYLAGDLLARHLEIFHSNQFFQGLSIPEPEVLVSCFNFSVCTYFGNKSNPMNMMKSMKCCIEKL